MGVTVGAVAAEMKKLKLRPGSKRDLTPMVRKFRDDQKAMIEMPPVIRAKVESFAADIWQLALANTHLVELQRGGGQSPEQRPRKVSGKEPRRPKLVVLAKAVEGILRPLSPDLVRAPATAVEIFRRLTDFQAALFDKDHFSRSLATMRSDVVYRLEDGKWWYRNRALPDDYGEEKPKRRYKSRGTPLSKTRKGNGATIEDAIALMVRERRALSARQIIDRLDIPAEKQWKFAEALRRRLYNNHPRYWKDRKGNYTVKPPET